MDVFRRRDILEKLKFKKLANLGRLLYLFTSDSHNLMQYTKLLLLNHNTNIVCK